MQQWQQNKNNVINLSCLLQPINIQVVLLNYLNSYFHVTFIFLCDIQVYSTINFFYLTLVLTEADFPLRWIKKVAFSMLYDFELFVKSISHWNVANTENKPLRIFKKGLFSMLLFLLQTPNFSPNCNWFSRLINQTKGWVSGSWNWELYNNLMLHISKKTCITLKQKIRMDRSRKGNQFTWMADRLSQWILTGCNPQCTPSPEWKEKTDMCILLCLKKKTDFFKPQHAHPLSNSCFYSVALHIIISIVRCVYIHILMSFRC